MKRHFVPALLILCAVLLIAAVAYAVRQPVSSTFSSVSNFSECEAAGYPIMESYPRQCKTPEGPTFVETIVDVSDPGDDICVNMCGDGTCAEIVCLGTGCPCAETDGSCPQDCAAR